MTRLAGLPLALLALAAAVAAGAPPPADLPLPCGQPGEPVGAGVLPTLRCGPANGGFEACDGCIPETGGVPDGWAPYVHPGGCPFLATWTDRAAHSGAASVAIDDRPATCTGITSEPFPVLPGLNYRASYWFKGEPTARSTIYIVWYASAGDGLQEYILKTGDRRAAPADWAEQAVVDVAPLPARAARVWAYGDMDAAGRFYVDDVAVVAIPEQLVFP